MGQSKRRKLLDPNYGKSVRKTINLSFGNIFRLRDAPKTRALLTSEDKKEFESFIHFVNPETANHHCGIVLFTQDFTSCKILGLSSQESCKPSFLDMFKCGHEEIKRQAVDNIKKRLNAQVIIEYAN